MATPAWVSYTKLHPPSSSQRSDFALLMNLKAAKWPTVCPSIRGGPQFCTIWTNTDFRQSLFFHLLCLSMLGKVPAPSSGLTLLEKVLTKEDTSFVILHFELTWKCLKSFSWHLTPGFILSSDRTSWGRMWSYSILAETGHVLNLYHSNSRPMNLTFPLCFQALKWDPCRLMTVPPNFTQMWSACWTLDTKVTAYLDLWLHNQYKLTRFVMTEVSQDPSPRAWNAGITWLISRDPAGLHN